MNPRARTSVRVDSSGPQRLSGHYGRGPTQEPTLGTEHTVQETVVQGQCVLLDDGADARMPEHPRVWFVFMVDVPPKQGTIVGR